MSARCLREGRSKLVSSQSPNDSNLPNTNARTPASPQTVSRSSTGPFHPKSPQQTLRITPCGTPLSSSPLPCLLSFRSGRPVQSNEPKSPFSTKRSQGTRGDLGERQKVEWRL